MYEDIIQQLRTLPAEDAKLFAKNLNYADRTEVVLGILFNLAGYLGVSTAEMRVLLNSIMQGTQGLPDLGS